MRAFIERNHTFVQRVALVLTFGGHSSPQKAVEMVGHLLNSEIKDLLTVHQDDIAHPDLTERVGRFAHQLQNQSTETG